MRLGFCCPPELLHTSVQSTHVAPEPLFCWMFQGIGWVMRLLFCPDCSPDGGAALQRATQQEAEEVSGVPGGRHGFDSWLGSSGEEAGAACDNDEHAQLPENLDWTVWVRPDAQHPASTNVQRDAALSKKRRRQPFPPKHYVATVETLKTSDYNIPEMSATGEVICPDGYAATRPGG